MNRNITEWLKLPESWRVPYFGGKWYRFINWLDNKSILKEKIQKDYLNHKPRAEVITLSLTSFPARIEYVHLSIRSLFLQTYKPDRIILWLAEQQFVDKTLPKQLLELQEYGLEIRFCSDDLFGHKKYFIPLIEQKQNEVVVTYDDDIIYPPNSLAKLMRMHQKFPKSIVCNRAQAYTENSDGTEVNPGNWKIISNEGVARPSFQLCPSTGGGCLYPCRALFEDAANKEKIVRYALRGDDLWIMFMALQQGTTFVKTTKYHKTFTVVNNSQREQLAKSNIIEDGYLKILKDLKTQYPEAWEKAIKNSMELRGR